MENTSTRKPKLRVLAAAALALVMTVALGGIAMAKPGHGNESGAQYQYGPGDDEYGPSGHQYAPGQKLTICHITRKGNRAKTLTIGANAATAHLRRHRNDHAGACTAQELAKNKNKNNNQSQNQNQNQGQNNGNGKGNGNGNGKGNGND